VARTRECEEIRDRVGLRHFVIGVVDQHRIESAGWQPGVARLGTSVVESLLFGLSPTDPTFFSWLPS
jgi:hypothetical protein